VKRNVLQHPVIRVMLGLLLLGLPTAAMSAAVASSGGPPAWDEGSSAEEERTPVGNTGTTAEVGKRSEGAANASRFIVVTYAGNEEQARSARALIRSVRAFGGSYRECPVYVILGDPNHHPCDFLKAKGVTTIPLSIDPTFRDYPLAFKAFAAAQMERLVPKADTLVWMDPGALVLNPPAALDLADTHDAAVRPVTLSNTIGLPAGAKPDGYWTPIFRETGLESRTLPTVETLVDEAHIQPYYNCEVYAVRPKLGICAEWARVLTDLLHDAEYQKTACTNFRKRLFLHQAVLSAVIQSRVRPDRLRALPLISGYPFNQHDRLAPDRQAKTLNDVSVVIFDDVWPRNPKWMDAIEIRDPLRSWLFDTYLEYLRLTDHLYRIEGSCNAYLVTTPDGSVLIDPAGASDAPQFFRKVLEQYPLQAILLTHAHRDHAVGIDPWRAGRDIPVIAQREYREYVRYATEFAPFFARRNAIWAGKPIPADPPADAPATGEPTVFFADVHTFELGGIHFKLTHTQGETPDHATIWIPELSAICVGDNYYEYFINNSTFRGTQIRPVRGYIHALDAALDLEPRYFLPGHGAPVVGKEDVAETVGRFRDALRYVYDETVRGINAGKDVYTLMQEVRLPPQYRIPQFYGKVSWTVRGIYQECVGWFDENPATMYEWPASSVYPELVELAGADAIVRKAQACLDQKEYVKVLHLTDVVLAADPSHQQARQVRRNALQALKAASGNYIEKIWLNYGIRLTGGDETP
jgi:glyoxylase-like metal-dependent hydrolase (beta-lactamase superfamily II)